MRGCAAGTALVVDRLPRLCGATGGTIDVKRLMSGIGLVLSLGIATAALATVVEPIGAIDRTLVGNAAAQEPATPPEPAPEPTPEPTPTEPSGTTNGEATTDGDGVPAWVWVIVGIAVVAVLLAVFLLGKGRGEKADSQARRTKTPAERQEILVAALSGWTSQGWTIESQTSDVAVLKKEGQRRQLRVDELGALHQQELPAPETGAEPPTST